MSLFRRKKTDAPPSYIDSLPDDTKEGLARDVEDLCIIGKRLFARLTPDQWSAAVQELKPSVTVAGSKIMRGMMLGEDMEPLLRQALGTVKLPVLVNELFLRATLALRDDDNG